MAHDPFLDPIRETLHETAALHALSKAAALGRVMALGIDVQQEYFFKPRLIAAGAEKTEVETFGLIATNIHGFLCEMDHIAPQIPRAYTVHTRIRKPKVWTAGALRNELAIKSRPQDMLRAKQFCDPFIESGLDEDVAQHNPLVILAFGGVLEYCLGAGIITATDMYNKNVILMPDLVAPKGGGNAQTVRAHFEIAQKPKTQGWVALADSHKVLKTLRTQAPAHQPVH
ncbi:MAG: hypothetical protein KGQ41_07265 [Alphaproteobacteria bacterium]|nr:hypothetical protein [Alphaproteobacteria bacterium]